MITCEETIEEYHANPAIGSSMFRDFISNPYEFEAKYVRRDHPEMTSGKGSHLILGQAVEDALTLDSDGYNEIYYSAPIDAPKKPTSAQMTAKKPKAEALEAIAWWKDFYNSKDISMIELTRDEASIIENCCESFYKNNQAVELWNEATYQLTVRTDKIKGAEIQCRFDGIVESRHHGIDMKTTSKPVSSFAKAVMDYRYDIQEAWYRSTYEIESGNYMPDFDFIVLETIYPYTVQVITLPEIVKDNAMAKCGEYMAKLLDCYRIGNFPQAPESIEPEFKYWQLKELGIEI